MKIIFLAGTVILSMLSGISNAGLLSPTTVTGTGTFSNNTSLISNVVVPVERSHWQSTTNVYWEGTAPTFTLDFGGLYKIDDVLASVDNNDWYNITYSINSLAWTNLFTIDKGDGEHDYGMDTMSTDGAHPEYVAGINFSSVQARYLRIKATGGDGMYSIGELQAFGSAAAELPVSVPEPSITALLAAGLFGLGFALRRRTRQS